MPTDTLSEKGGHMHRIKLRKNKDRKVFSKTSKQHPSNTVTSVMRGGIRK